MITEELVEYVKGQRQAGVSDQVIREALLSVGWTTGDADKALLPLPAPASEKPKEVDLGNKQPPQEIKAQPEYPSQPEDSQKPQVEDTLKPLSEEKPIISEEKTDPVELNEQGLPLGSSKPLEQVENKDLLVKKESPSVEGSNRPAISQEPVSLKPEPAQNKPQVDLKEQVSQVAVDPKARK